ncbi:ABC transporter ATP-binding protein [Actibacterium sp.]|uniref:ABC transporter ATP-binding protein n=1 Tax=Actibacterium sp. TaxID=1872125 RepID=UPI0035686657
MVDPAHTDGKLILRWLWGGYLRRFLGLIFAALFLMGIEGSMMGALSYTIGPMFDELFVARNRAALPWIAGAIFAVFVLRALSGFGQRVLMAKVGQRLTADLQSDMVRHMLGLDLAWFQKTPPGNLIERVRGDTNALATLWSNILAAAGRDVIATLSLFAVALSVDWLWTVIALAGVPLLVLPITRLQDWVRGMARQARSSAATISTRLDEIFHGVPTIRLNRMEARENRRFDEALDGFVDASIRSEAGRAAIPALMDVIAGLGFLGVVVYGGLQIMDGTKTVGQFMSFFTAMALVFEPLRRIDNVSGAWQTALASLERLYAVFLERPTILSPAQPATLPAPAGALDIVVRDVQLGYDETPVLNGLTLTAKAGQMTALVGASGAGKTTVFSLLTRLIEPQSGTVTLGDVPIETLALDDLRSQFSVVSQEALLFDETLRDNILLGRTDVSEDQLNAVLDAAHITDFLPGLPNGLDSPAGPRGTNLSGGQRQRVAIARALLRDAPILLLDEATSALDAKSERVVQEALERLSKGRTTLVIAHRLATVRDADLIIVMDKGRVVEQGTHEALLAQGGVYSGLYQLQFASDS